MRSLHTISAHTNTKSKRTSLTCTRRDAALSEHHCTANIHSQHKDQYHRVHRDHRTQTTARNSSDLLTLTCQLALSHRAVTALPSKSGGARPTVCRRTCRSPRSSACARRAFASSAYEAAATNSSWRMVPSKTTYKGECIGDFHSDSGSGSKQKIRYSRLQWKACHQSHR